MSDLAFPLQQLKSTPIKLSYKVWTHKPLAPLAMVLSRARSLSSALSVSLFISLSLSQTLQMAFGHPGAPQDPWVRNVFLEFSDRCCWGVSYDYNKNPRACVSRHQPWSEGMSTSTRVQGSARASSPVHDVNSQRLEENTVRVPIVRRSAYGCDVKRLRDSRGKLHNKIM